MTDISLEAVAGKLNRIGYDAFLQALRQAKRAGNRNVELAHWLWHILQKESTDLDLTADYFKIDRTKLFDDLDRVVREFRANETEMPGVSNTIIDMLDRGWHYATLFFGETQIRSGHLLAAAVKSIELKRALLTISAEFDKINGDVLTDKYQAIWEGSEEENSASAGRLGSYGRHPTRRRETEGSYQVSESLTPEADSRIGIYLIHHGKQLLGEFAMSTPVPLRSDFDTIGLRMLARRSRDPDQTRRLLALAEIYDGGSRPDAARIGGVGVQIVRDWVVRFNAKGPDGLLTGKAPGAPSILGERQRQALRQVVEDGPIPALHGVVRWRLIDLAQWLFEEFRVSISKPTLSRELRHMGFRKLSARPRHHAQDEEAAAAFKKTFSPSWRRPPQKRLLASR